MSLKRRECVVVGKSGNQSKAQPHEGEDQCRWGKTLAISPLLLGWLIAGLLRISIGSSTVSVQTAATLMAPIIASKPGVNKELLILAMGSGSLILSHVNDSGFWFVKEYLGLSIEQTLKTWTVVETGIACVSIVFILLVNAFV